MITWEAPMAEAGELYVLQVAVVAELRAAAPLFTEYATVSTLAGPLPPVELAPGEVAILCVCAVDEAGNRDGECRESVCPLCGSDDPKVSMTDDGITTTPDDMSPGVCHGPFHDEPSR